jgi:hypothetical protein
MLPSRALQLINEYVKPITRPDWRSFERSITPEVFISQLRDLTILHKSILFMTAYNNMRYSEFHTMYIWLEISGVDSYIHFNGGCKNTILSNRWLFKQQQAFDEL